jgi:O-antigen ligase
MEINKKIVLDIFFKFFFFILPFLLISGPFLPDLFISLISLCFLIYCLYNKIFYLLKKKLIIFFLIFYFYININSFFSFTPLVSYSTTAPYVRMILFSIFVGYLLHNILNVKKIIFYSFLASYLILFFDSLIQINTGQNILEYPIVNNRVASLFRDKLIMGSYVSRSLPILIAISYFEDFKYNNFLRFFSICLGGVLVFFSAERVSSFYYVMTVIVYFILLPDKKKIFIYMGLLVIIFVALVSYKPSSVSRIYNHTITQVFEKNNKTGLSIFSYRHEAHFITAYKMFLDKKLFGHGVKSFRYLCDQDPYSHRNKIIDENTVFSPINGYFFIVQSNPNWKKYYLIEKEKKTEFLKIIESLELEKKSNDQFFITSDTAKINNFEINNSIIYFKSKSNLLTSAQHSTFVKKGDFIFSENEFSNGCNTHPHNIHLQILAELGFFGYFFLLSFLVYLILLFARTVFSLVLKKKSPRSKKCNLYLAFITIGLIQSFFPLLPSGNIFNNWISSFIYFKLGFLFNYLYYDRQLDK